MVSMRNKKKYHQIRPLIWSFAIHISYCGDSFALSHVNRKVNRIGDTTEAETSKSQVCVQGPVVQN